MTPSDSSDASLASTLLRVAWASILLGIAMELLFVAADALFASGGEAKKYLADVAQKVSWSSIVCLGLALGTAAARARALWMGIAGALAAPAAFHVARTLHRSASQALNVATPGPIGPSPLVLSLVKAAEYAFLGFALAWAARRAAPRLGTHVRLGLLAGVLFGGAIVVLRAIALNDRGALAMSGLAALALNELAFPVGCSLVIYAAGALGARAARAAPSVGYGPDAGA